MTDASHPDQPLGGEPVGDASPGGGPVGDASLAGDLLGGELAAPALMLDRGRVRLEGLVRLSGQVAVLQARMQLELNALSLEDTEFGYRQFLCDDLSLYLQESPGTALRWIGTALRGEISSRLRSAGLMG